MSNLESFHEPHNIKVLLAVLKAKVDPSREYRFMEFCGGHTHAFFSTGLIDLLPENIQMVHGPGCPVCVLPSSRIGAAIKLCEKNPTVILCCYGDLLRVPCLDGDNLLQAKARGLQIRSIYSPLDALDIARKNPLSQVVFMAIGFETTTPPTVLALKSAIAEGLNNFSIFCNHVKTAPALEAILASSRHGRLKLDGIIGPGHVASVTGASFFEQYALEHQVPIVVTGFTPFDLIQSLIQLVALTHQGVGEVQTEYNRVVKNEGNLYAQELMQEFLVERESFEWRGLGELPHSAYRLRGKYAQWDAESLFEFEYKEATQHPQCLCSQVILGEKRPTDCKLFGKVCTPDRPYGACMVSSEGACAAYFQAGKHHD